MTREMRKFAACAAFTPGLMQCFEDKKHGEEDERFSGENVRSGFISIMHRDDDRKPEQKLLLAALQIAQE